GEVEERYRLDHAQVNLAFVRVPAAGEEKGISLTDEDLAKYLQDHSDRYRVPANIRARYVAYRRTDFLAQAEVPESAITDYYELHKDDRFTEPEQVHARHILVKVANDAGEPAKTAARKKAEDLLAKVRAGGDFAALARKQAEADRRAVVRGKSLAEAAAGRAVEETPPFAAADEIPGVGRVKAFADAAFALREGEVSDLVETDDAIYLLTPFERTEAH